MNLASNWKLFDHFGPDELEARHKLLFKLVGIIWK